MGGGGNRMHTGEYEQTTWPQAHGEGDVPPPTQNVEPIVLNTHLKVINPSACAEVFCSQLGLCVCVILSVRGTAVPEDDRRPRVQSQR